MPKESQSGPGRPPADLSAKLLIFEKALVGGHKVGKALELAEIAESTYYAYLDKNPEYVERVNYLKQSLESVAEGALSRQLEAEPKDEKHRQEIAALAKWVIDERRSRRAASTGLLPPGQLTGPQQININLGNQVMKAEDLEGLTDDELALVSSRTKTIEQVMEDRKTTAKAGTKKPQP